MRITVLNGSPRGDKSVGIKSALFLQKKFPQHEFDIQHVGIRIKQLESDTGAFQEIIDKVRASDGVLWSFPLYILIVPYQLKRFIELIWERGAQDAFAGKYAAVFSTSIHFFDHTAHNYMNGICDDLHMKYVGSHSAHPRDFLEAEQRDKLLLFAQGFLDAIERNAPTLRNYGEIKPVRWDYTPGKVARRMDVESKRVLVLTDSDDQSTNLGKMVYRFCASLAGEVEVVNLHDVDIKGPCLECLHCGIDNVCTWDDRDGFRAFYDTVVRSADIIVCAGEIVDRYLSSRWKLFWDRSFCWTHTPMLIGKQVAFFISGPLRQIPNIREIFEAWAEYQRCNLVSFVTDESEDSTELDALLDNLAERVIWGASTGYVKERTFLGIGGMKIFRDDIWGPLRFVFQADHRFYKAHGYYDFPQRDIRAGVTNMVMMTLTKIPSMKEGFQKVLVDRMNEPYDKIIDEL